MLLTSPVSISLVQVELFAVTRASDEVKKCAPSHVMIFIIGHKDYCVSERGRGREHEEC